MPLKAYFNKALKKLAKDCPGNATIICNYIIAEQREINIKQTTKEGKIKILIWLSNFHSGKSFKEMTKIDILNYLHSLRKTQVQGGPKIKRGLVDITNTESLEENISEFNNNFSRIGIKIEKDDLKTECRHKLERISPVDREKFSWLSNWINT